MRALLTCILLVTAWVFTGAVQAMPMYFDDESTFDAAVSGPDFFDDLNDLSTGNLGPSVNRGGNGFSQDFSALTGIFPSGG